MTRVLRWRGFREEQLWLTLHLDQSFVVANLESLLPRFLAPRPVRWERPRPCMRRHARAIRCLVAQIGPSMADRLRVITTLALSQINRGNVQRLKEAWKFDAAEEGGLETSPIIVGRTLFAYTASQKVIALDASTGKLLWKFDSGIHSTQPARGLAYWSDGQHGRILAGVMNYLYALDAETGKVIPSFGEQGRIDLRKGLRGDYLSQSVALTSPGIVYQDLIIVGGRNPETYPSPPGDIRAFDVRTGSLRWTFSHHPSSGRIRLRHLARRCVENRRRGEQLGGDGAG